MALHPWLRSGRFLVVAAIAAAVWGTCQWSRVGSSAALATQPAVQQSEPRSAAPAASDRTTGSPQSPDEKAGKFRPRLPMYYGTVVTEEQRARIYAIQKQYWPQIRALQEQLESLTAERDAKIEAVLTDDQKATIAQLKAEAAAKRADARKTRPEASPSASRGTSTR